MVEIQRTYRFCASHRLARADWEEEENRRVFGTASHPSGHGHNYRLTVVLAGEPDPETERLVDLDALDRLVGERVIQVYDHHNLNADVPTLLGRVPTLERLLQDVWERLAAELPGGLLREVRLAQDEFLAGVYRGPAAH